MSEPTRAEMLGFLDELKDNADVFSILSIPDIREDKILYMLDAIRKLIEESK